MIYPHSSLRDFNRTDRHFASKFRLRRFHWAIMAIAAVSGAALYSLTLENVQAKRVSALTQQISIPSAPPGVAATDTPAAEITEVAALEPVPATNETATATSEQDTETVQTLATELPATATATDDSVWKQATVQKGDSMARIFDRAGISARELHQVMQLGAAVTTLKRIHPGQQLHFRVDSDNHLLELRYEESVTRGLKIQREGEEFVATSIHRIPDRQTAHASAVIDSSLFMAGQQANLSDSLTMDLAGIFGWDIDFALDIREGDRFTVLYDELFLDGERIGDGNILAAEFVNQGQVFRAIRYTDSDGQTGYYTPEGRSMRKAFLRTPVELSRITSGFNLKRKHPILNRIRAHKGVDYAAAIGTPIKSTGDGRVVFRGVKGGYGNVVIIQHGSTYSTLYAHMSKFARGVNTGTRVRQGQTIGYIGKSGLATGPHLHYEFLVNGTHRNPLAVKFPDANPIDKRFRDDFEKTAQDMLAKLDLVRDRTTQVALKQE